ncbi:hypothetical protein CKA32_001151 [Geitlerinema sp. FC II]|nr:hypothetical protein CKA32_001151 [Geitlerinema sp. FC II]
MVLSWFPLCRFIGQIDIGAEVAIAFQSDGLGLAKNSKN